MDFDNCESTNISEISVALSASTSNSQSHTSSDESTRNSQDLSKKIRGQFFSNIKTYDTNWSATCILCKKIQYDKKGVTSNINRHVKTKHKEEYNKWISQLNDAEKEG